MPAQAVAMLACQAVLVSGSYLAGVFWAGRNFYEPSFVNDFLWNDNGVTRLLLLIATVIGALYLTDRQLGWQPQPPLKTFQQACLVVGLAFITQAFLGYVVTGLIVPRYVMLLGSLILLIAITVFRMLYPAFRPNPQ